MIGTKRHDPFITLTEDHAEQSFRFVNGYDTGGTTMFPDQASLFGGGLNLFSDATSDRIMNQVDSMVMPWLDELAVLVVVPLAYPAVAPTLTPPAVMPEVAVDAPTIGSQEIAAELRDAIDLAVQDVAAMVGVSRRRYYELLNGESPSLDTESRMARLLTAFQDLGSHLGGDPRLLRSAVLTPAGTERVSLYEAAVEGDIDAMGRIVKTLTERFRSGTVHGLGPRPVPRTRVSKRGRKRAREVVEDTPAQGRSKDDGGDG